MHIDDSVHAMLEHEKRVAKKKGEEVHYGYKPRASHPLLGKNTATPGSSTSCEGTDAEDSAVTLESSKASETEANTLLYHTAHHGDTVDPRDLQESSARR